MYHETIALNKDATMSLDCYVLDPQIATGVNKVRPAIVIAPGGAYLKLAHREGEVVAARFLGLGYNVFVLRYPTYVVGKPAVQGGMPQTDPDARYPVQIVSAMRAMAYVRKHAREWLIDPQRTYALGFSAGAHVMASLCERFDDERLLAMAQASAGDVLPSGLVLCYPMLSANKLCGQGPTGTRGLMEALVSQALFGKDEPSSQELEAVDLQKHVRVDFPRTFVWQTAADEVVDAAETTDFVAALQRLGVPVEYHLFESGPHGMSLADATSCDRDELVDSGVASWVEHCARWAARTIG